MGFWLGTLTFLAFEGAGFGVIRVKRRGDDLLAQTLWATTVVCCWTMWAAVYLAQMHPLVRPVLTG